jgi:DNA repair exonuclease SbcCD ATPase subunit
MSYVNPHIKVTWADTSESFTPEKIKSVKEYFKQKYNTRFVKVITKIVDESSDAVLKSLEVSDSILEPEYQKKLMKDFLKENDIKVNIDYIDRLDNKVNEELFQKEENRVKYNRWYVKTIEFDNFLSFGKGNKIDFTELDGITVVESTPRNFGGKTTATVDLLLFLFFNTTTKATKNSEIFNRFLKDSSYVRAKGVISIDGDDYIIERTISRKLNRSNEFNVSGELSFSKILPDGTTQNLSGEQRRETEKFITTAIGTQEDFLSTILTTGSNLESLIESKPTARGQILSKFLGLDNLREKERICSSLKNDYSKKLISNTNNRFTLEQDIEKYHKDIIEKDELIQQKNKSLDDFTNNLKQLEDRKEKILSEKHTDVDEDLVKTNPTTIKREISDVNDKIKSISKTLKETKVKEPKEYYLEDKHDSIKDKIRDLNFQVKEDELTIERHQDKIKQLTEGSVCPTCKRPLEGVDHTKEIDSIKKEIKTVETNIKKTNKNVDKSTEEEKKFSTLKKEYDLYERNKLVNARYELEIDQKKLDLEKLQQKLDYFETNKKKHERNIEINKELIILRTKIDTASSEIKQCNIQIERSKNEISNLKERIETNKQLIVKIKQEEEIIKTYDIYMSVFGKNGISKTILKRMIPLLNMELSHLLDDSCFFKLEVSMNKKNELEFMMIDSDTRVVKPLFAGSGYEKTIASLALRSVLTKVSSLPKPNIVVMDEVFGKIADENLEMVGEFFKKIKNYFEHIFVISHNPLVRNWSDNLLMIEKEENISTIKSVSVKI